MIADEGFYSILICVFSFHIIWVIWQ
jgi:hypothetical protein